MVVHSPISMLPSVDLSRFELKWMLHPLSRPIVYVVPRCKAKVNSGPSASS